MTAARNLQRDFYALRDPDEPRHGCAVLAESRESKHGAAMAKTIRQIILDPLDWYIQKCFEKYGPNSSLDSANAFRLAADDIRYRFAYKQMICDEEIEALERKWVAFQASVGWDDWCQREKFTTAAPKGHEAAHGTAEQKAERWSKYRSDCIRVAKENPRWGLMAIRLKVAEMNGVSDKTIKRHVPGLAEIIKNA